MSDSRHTWETRAYREIIEMDVVDSSEVTFCSIVKWVPVFVEDEE